MAEHEKLQLMLAILSGPDDGRRIQFRRAGGDGADGPNGTWLLTLGRRDDCDLCLPFDTQISREHAWLYCQHDGTWFLEDNGSRNGTFIGKNRVDHAEALETGVMFRIGRTWLRLEKME
ncbi:FHA domain-containing protein [Chloroflexota bacterium]